MLRRFTNSIGDMRDTEDMPETATEQVMEDSLPTDALPFQTKSARRDDDLRLANFYRTRDEWELALTYHERYVTLKEDIRAEENQQKLQALEAHYQTRQMQHQAETERQLRADERRRYEQLNRLKDDILNTTSHDLKSPLIGLKHTVFALRRHGRLDDERGQALLADIESAIRHMRHLIINVLNLASLQTGRLSDFKPCNLIELMMLVCNRGELYTIAQHKGVQLRIDHPSTPITLVCDAPRLEQALQNVLSNALKYTETGGHVSVAALVQPDSESVTITITDTGIGIPDYALPYIFERFYRVPEARHQAIEGTGLGLAIVKAIIEQHGGSITVTSQVDQGSRFEVTLPLTPSAAFKEEDGGR